MKSKSILLLLILTCGLPLFAAEKFEFSLGDQINVLSDKGYRHSKSNTFEAVGSVVIVHKTKTLYGEKATLNMGDGQAHIVGNVRYVGPEMTLYGSEINYNFQTDKLSVDNARILSDNYVMLAKRIDRTDRNTLVSRNAEYTTCRDCPESWSIYGKKVVVTLGEYIRITHAFIKVKGVVVMYIPYLVLPIKKKRETGLLFPNFGFGLEEGLRFQQPFFWAIDDQKDMTLSPTSWGDRGYGGELEYRQVLGHGKWFEINSLVSWDEIYEKYKTVRTESGTKKFRHLSDYEHHFATSYNFSHHLFYDQPGDLDIGRDYEPFIGHRIRGSHFGLETSFNWRSDLINTSVEGYFNRNMLVQDPEDFDNSTVQILPRLTMGSVPFVLWNHDGNYFSKALFGVEGEFTHFKQNHLQEGAFIRNSYRTHGKSWALFNLAQWGPLSLRTQSEMDFQYYEFPYEEQSGSFSKRGLIQETTLSLSAEKLFGVSSYYHVPLDRVELGKDGDATKQSVGGVKILGELPRFKKGFAEDNVKVVKSAYRHNMDILLKHYYLADQKFDGSSKFLNQIRTENGGVRSAGLFDALDAIRGKENELAALEARTGLPKSNTVELQWNNMFIKKTPKKEILFDDQTYLPKSFSYSQVSFFNVSQGYDMNISQGELEDKLTRLAINTGVTMNRSSFTIGEYYYWRTSEHATKFRFRQRWDRFSLGGTLTLDPFGAQINRFLTLSASTSIIPAIGFNVRYEYDIEQKLNSRNLYNVLYQPSNRCWMLNLSYDVTPLQKRYSVNFLINFNDNNFKGLSGGS